VVQTLIVYFITTNMGQDIVYQWVENGDNIVISVTDTPDINIETSGFADLTAGRVTISNFNAGKAVIITRNQDNTTAIGNLYIYAPNTIPNVSFEIRSTNVNDNGTVYWQIVE
jgi:hypothetical protein